MKITRLATLALCLCAATTALADGIAFLSNVKGEVAIDGNPHATILAELARGQRITLGRDAFASVMYIVSGKEYALRGPAEFVVKETEVAGSSGIPPMVRNTEWRTSSKVVSQVAQSSAASVRMRSIAPPKADTGPGLLFPTQGNVSTLQPTFRWRSDGKARGELAVFVPGEEKPVHAASAAGSSYRLPVRLKPETEYVWTYTVAGNELGSGRFRTLPEAAVRDLERHRPGDAARFSDRVLFTLMLHELGAIQEAQESWKRLSQERGDLPELSALAR
jgi:hypothetical protein